MHVTRRMLGVGLLLSLLAGGCNWAMAGFDGANTNNNATESGFAGRPLSLAKRWTVDGASLDRQPAVVDGVVYLLHDRYQANGVFAGTDVRALDASSGQQRWATLQSTSFSSGALAVAGGLVYVRYGNAVTALHAGDGSRAWSAATGGDSTGPWIVDGLVYAGDSALDASTGAVRGRTANGETVLAVSGGVVYTAAQESATSACHVRLRARSAATAGEFWNTLIDQSFTAPSATVSGGSIVVTTFDCGTQAQFGMPSFAPFTRSFNAATGVLNWTTPGEGPMGASGDIMYFLDDGGQDNNSTWGINGVGMSDRRRVWSSRLRGCALGTNESTRNVAVAGEVLFAPNAEGICAADAATGRALGSWPTSSGGPLVVADGCVYVEGGSNVSSSISALCTG